MKGSMAGSLGIRGGTVDAGRLVTQADPAQSRERAGRVALADTSHLPGP